MLTREMKDSGIEWIGEIPKEWNVIDLGKVASIQTGNTPSSSSQEVFSKIEGIEWIKTDNLLGTQGISNAKLKISPDFIKQSRVAPENSVLICCIGDIGKLGFTLKEVAYNQQINAVIFDDKFVFWKFGMYSLFVQKEQHNYYSNGNVLRILNGENQKKIKITIPSNLIEQEKIAVKLDALSNNIDNIISKTQQSIDELKKYKQSIITEAVTKGLDQNVKMKDSGIQSFGEIPAHWKINKVRNLFTLNKGLTITKNDLKEEGVPVISYGEIHSKYGFRFDLKKHPVMNVDEKYIETNADAIIRQGDFIFADTSEDLDGSGNFTCYVSDELCFAGYHTVILKPKNKINYNYFAYLFDSLAFRSQIQQRVQGIKVFSITQRILKPLQVVLPTQQEQEEIVYYLDKKMESINKLIEDKSLVIEEFEQYKKSLIYEFVTGKIEA